MNFYDLAKSRYSVRSYQPKKVSREEIDKLIGHDPLKDHGVFAGTFQEILRQLTTDHLGVAHPKMADTEWIKRLYCGQPWF